MYYSSKFIIKLASIPISTNIIRANWLRISYSITYAFFPYHPYHLSPIPFLICSAGDGTQGLVHASKYSTTKLHPQPYHSFLSL